MSIHRYHPDPDRHDPPDALLFDDCERCTEHAYQLFSLDTAHLRALCAVWGGRIPTQTEVQASANLWRSLLAIERLTGVSWRELIGAEASA